MKTIGDPNIQSSTCLRDSCVTIDEFAEAADEAIEEGMTAGILAAAAYLEDVADRFEHDNARQARAVLTAAAHELRTRLAGVTP